jgi:hypothetical protein
VGLLIGIPGSAPAAEADPAALLDRMQAVWKARDVGAYLALWEFAGEEARALEREYVQSHWSGDESVLEIERPSAFPRSGAARVAASVVSVTEPRGRVEQAVFTLREKGGGWSLVQRQTVAEIDGLVHLSLGRQGYRADGKTLKLPDFELQFRRGTLFLPPASLGPTALVFVGEATVRFSPGPNTEREQLRQFCGKRELVERVRAAFIRIHPADLHRVLVPGLLESDPRADAVRDAAQRFFGEHAGDTYILDAPLPRSPWWLLPAVGDAVVIFQSRRGALTFAVSQSQPEALSLFDRARHRQINLYALPGREGAYDEDAERDVDVLHHDLEVRFEPDRFGILGRDTVRLRLLSPTTTIRLRLDESLNVISIRSREGGEHMFFRIRHQDSLMVSLGALSGRTGEITLTVRYAGVHRPEPVDREILPGAVPRLEEGEIQIEETLVFSNRTAWYPIAGKDDYATASMAFDVPSSHMAVASGTHVSARGEAGRTRVEYRQDLPAKYLTVAVGRLYDGSRREESGVAMRVWSAAHLRGVGDQRLAQAAAILRFYAGLFGPPPYPSLNLVLVQSRVPGGHSPPGMVVVAVRPPLLRSPLRDDPASFPDLPDFFLAHELAHQWWGHGVAGQNYHERWVSEAFAQYAAASWVRHSRGEAVFRGMLERMGKWALRYASKGPIHLGHRLGHIEGDPQVYRAVVYNKGAYVLHMLRQIIGEQAFREAGKALQRDHRFDKIGTAAVRAALERASGRDLRAYFDEWVYGTSLPELRLATRSHRGTDGYRTEITVRGTALPGPVPLEITVAHPGGTEVRTVSLAPEGGTWTVDTPGRPRRVEVNASRGLLARVRRE